MGLASAQTGAFEVLADVSGVVVRSLKNGTGAVVAPSDSIGLFLCESLVMGLLPSLVNGRSCAVP